MNGILAMKKSPVFALIVKAPAGINLSNTLKKAQP